MASMLFRKGAEYLFFWDSEGSHGRADHKHQWNALRRLGHREEIDAWIDAGEPEIGEVRVPLRTCADWHMGTIAPG